MKYIILLCNFYVFSQEVSRNTISVIGNSGYTNNGYYIAQSVGQLSTVGLYDFSQNAIIQGYQQPSGFRIIDNIAVKETVLLYPIPVTNTINILFSSSKVGDCVIEVFDRLGRSILKEQSTVLNSTASISLLNLATASYIIKITANKSIFYETIIKE